MNDNTETGSGTELLQSAGPEEAGETVEPKSLKRWINRSTVLSFIAGMLVTLIVGGTITVSLGAAGLNGEVLTGTAISKADIVLYKMFPSQIGMVQSSSSTKYMGQLSLFAHNFTSKDFYYLCDGRKIDIESNSYLYSLYGKRFGGDGFETMGLPNLQNKFPVNGMNYYMVGAFGTYPFYEYRNDTKTVNDILYAPYDASGYPKNRRAVETETFLGEIGLYKVKEGVDLKGALIPCLGQTLESAKYPKLAKMMVGRSATTFTLPDLRGMSPIPGAEYFISAYGNDWYAEIIPAGYMKCVSCRKIVQKARSCPECGAQNQ